ncbi:MAG: glycosyltransferase [Pseudomonadales bacterium]
MNRERIDVVRRLREALGPRFTGGLEDNAEAQRRAPQYIYRAGTDKHSYIALMKQHLVGVTSPGLHGSVGWKFAEYIAAACCIVAPLLPAGQSDSFNADTNYLPWNSLDDCVDACERLLNSPDQARAMQQENARYYARTLRPDVLLRHCIDVATAHGS